MLGDVCGNTWIAWVASVWLGQLTRAVAMAVARAPTDRVMHVCGRVARGTAGCMTMTYEIR